jgi:hypothetical protein
VDHCDEGRVVLLLVEPSYAKEAIALRDARHHAVLPIGLTPEDTTSLLTTMGARHGELDLGHSRYGNVCVVAAAHRQAKLIAFVATTVWPVVAAGWLHACEPPYDRARAHSVSTAEAQAALEAGSAQRS